MESVRINRDETDRLLCNLRSLPNDLADLVSMIDDGTLRWRPIPTRWSVKEILCHLRDFERDAMHVRYRAILAEDDPYLARLDNDAKQAEGDYINQDGAPVLGELERLRLETIALLGEVPPAAWARTGRHFSAGRVTLEQTVARHVKHDMTHLAQIRDIIGLKLPF